MRKVGFIPDKGADPDQIEEQEVFRQEKLEPLLEEAKAGKRAVFFVDAAHFVHRVYLGFIGVFHSHLYPLSFWSQALQCLCHRKNIELRRLKLFTNHC